MLDTTAALSAEPPFGAFRPSGWERLIVTLARAASAAAPRIALGLRALAPAAMTHPIDCEVFGLRMRLLGQSNVAERRLLFQPSNFDPAERRFLQKTLKPGDLFVDIGANVGVYALLAARLVGRSGRVLAIEPQPPVFRRLKTNIGLNPDLSIEACEIALGDRDGATELHLNPLNDGEASLTPSAPGRAVIQVRQTTLAGFAAERGITRIDCAKIDVEGAEPLVLDPFYSSAPRSLWPHWLIIERNARLWPRDLIAELVARGYRIALTTRLNHVLELA